jgi:hypothetical protein
MPMPQTYREEQTTRVLQRRKRIQRKVQLLSAHFRTRAFVEIAGAVLFFLPPPPPNPK